MKDAPAALPPVTAERALAGLVVRAHGQRHVSLLLARPDVHNALNARTLTSLTEVLRQMPPSVRTISLEGQGPSFCAGADLRGWHDAFAKAQGGASSDQDLRDALARSDAVVPEALAALFAAMQAARQIIVAKVHGVAAAGGVGLIAAADIVIAADDARFSFPEVRLGLVPAMIAPYVERAIGPSRTRYLFLTAAVLSAAEALEAGLVHRVVALDELEASCAQVVRALWRGGPEALAEAKQLLNKNAGLPLPQQLEHAHAASERIRRGSEMREGVRAFFDRDAPAWRSQ